MSETHNRQQHTDASQNPAPHADSSHGKPGMRQVIASVFASLLGVQSEQNRQRDFRHGDARDYIGVYILLVLALVIGMVITVKLVLANAGA